MLHERFDGTLKLMAQKYQWSHLICTACLDVYAHYIKGLLKVSCFSILSQPAVHNASKSSLLF